jgi:hypothetical protein
MLIVAAPNTCGSCGRWIGLIGAFAGLERGCGLTREVASISALIRSRSLFGNLRGPNHGALERPRDCGTNSFAATKFRSCGGKGIAEMQKGESPAPFSRPKLRRRRPFFSEGGCPPQTQTEVGRYCIDRGDRPRTTAESIDSRTCIFRRRNQIYRRRKRS